jgi:hypothetical protein
MLDLEAENVVQLHGQPYAPTVSSIWGAVDDVMVLLQSMTDGSRAT